MPGVVQSWPVHGPCVAGAAPYPQGTLPPNVRQVVTLRILLYFQFLLGIAHMFPFFIGPVFSLLIVMGLHLAVAVVITLLAPLALGPVPGVPEIGVRKLARIFPLAPLLLGLAIFFGVVLGPLWVGLHILLGIATIALVEIAAARQRRALQGGSVAS